ncbi:MAG: TRAP transporter small permease subunit [Alphaproteobacteria bacterium]|nr:TRAP transporter small permease subunit [Alphaproteobacteria bacterium]
MESYVRIVTGLSRLCGVAAVLLIVAALLAVCHMVFVRGVLGQGVIWQTEFATFALVAATFIGSPYVLLSRGHVNVELLPLYLGPRARRALALATAAAAMLFCLALLWDAAIWWWEAFEGGWTTDSVWRARLWIPYLGLPVGAFVLVLQYVADIWSVASGRAHPFGMPPETGL